MLDAGVIGIVIEDDLTVIRGDQPAGILWAHPQHRNDVECVRHHCQR